MDNNSLQRVKELIDSSRSIGIAVGSQAGLDEMAAALSLYLSLKYANKQVSIASPVQPTVAISNLVGIDKVKMSLGGGESAQAASGDLIVSFPYREGEIEKVSYTIDGGYLNIVVKAGEQGLAFSEQDVLFKRGNATQNSGSVAPDLLFVIGTPRLSDLGNLFNPEALRDTRVINIDYKAENQGFGDVVLVSGQFSSVSEQITDLLLGLNYEVDLDIAQNLLSGITEATDEFRSPNTSSFAFELSGILMRKGANRQPSYNQPMPQPRPQVQRPANPFGQGVASNQQPSQFGQATGMPSMPRPMPQPRQQMTQPESHSSLGGQPQAMPSPFGQGAQHPRSPFMNQPASQPTQSVNYTGQQGQSQGQDSQDEAPSDWLTPKVYKGSTSV